MKFLVHHVARMGYCEGCKHKAPKNEREFQDYQHINSLKNINRGFTIRRWGENEKESVKA